MSLQIHDLSKARAVTVNDTKPGDIFRWNDDLYLRTDNQLGSSVKNPCVQLSPPSKLGISCFFSEGNDDIAILAGTLTIHGQHQRKD
ncbi:MAG: hypothetical protein IT366_21445 [Candidatus Hydrogenedentes bacterium]|nr:hypothetical protein [Candidatus Hydrogenedentota bacterium]